MRRTSLWIVSCRRISSELANCCCGGLRQCLCSWEELMIADHVLNCVSLNLESDNMEPLKTLSPRALQVLHLFSCNRNYLGVRSHRRQLQSCCSTSDHSSSSPLVGVILTYGLYFLFVFPLNFSFAGATLWCVIIGFISTLGLAFSEYFRSIALLSLPSFFSSKGRQALTTYAIILAVTGPGKNSLSNVRALSDSIGCSQERVRKSLKDVFYLTKNPYVAIKQSLSVVIARIMEVAKKMKAITTAIKKQVLAMDEVCIMAAKSLNKVAALCQSKGRHPYDTCTRALNAAADDSKVSPNCLFGGIYQSENLPHSMCNRFRTAESICSLPSDTSDQISKKVQMKLSAFVRRLYNLLSFKLTKSHESHYELFKSRQVKDVVNAIATDLRELTGSILYLFDSVSVLFSFFYIYLFYSVITFRNKYLAHEWYENRYITSNLLLIEMRRIRQKKTTIFPLSRIESQKYIKINSLNLGTMDVYEMYNMIIKAVALLIKLSLHMAADYGLWWLIMQCRRAANHVQIPEGMSDIEVLTCKADGLSGEIYNEIANAFQPTRFNFTTDMTSCLPEPSVPDIKRNITIMLIGILTVIIGFMEPYGKRLKISIMNFYYPIIARRRAVWLYNHIHRTRNSFTRVARRRLRRQYGRWDRKEPEEATFMYRFRCKLGQKIPIARLRMMINPKEKYNRCILCKAFGAPDDPLTSCVTPGCKGTYCLECFANLQNLCTICMKPIEYHDISDMSEERDSSDEEKQLRIKTLGKTASGIIAISSESEASTADSDDFDLMLDGIRSNMNIEKCDLDDVPYAHQSFTGNHRKVKDWATMQDFELPKGEQAQYAMAEQGIAMTLSFRIRTGFSGLLFAKPVFGRAAELEHMDDTLADHSFNTEYCYQDDRENIVRSPMRLDLHRVPKKVLKFVKRALSRTKRKRRKKYELSRTSPSRYDSGSGYGSRRSLPGYFSGKSTKVSTDQENFKILERGHNTRYQQLQVYQGLQMSECQYQGLESSSGSEAGERFDDSSDSTDVQTTRSVSWSADKHYSQEESTKPGDTMTSQLYESSSSFSRRSYSSLKRDATTTGTSYIEQDSELSDSSILETHFSAVPARPSFRNIKVLPTKSQVTHQMFNVDESD